MREREKGGSPDPVPVRVKISCIIMSTLLMAASVAAGKHFSGGDIAAAEIPVVLADGSVIKQPWYIDVDGKCAAVVKTEEDADDVIEDLIGKYSSGTGESDKGAAMDDSASVLDIELKENVSVERMELRNGDSSPDILDRQEAGEKIETGDDGGSMITVVVTEEKTEEEKIGYDREYKTDDSLYTGQTRIGREGKSGKKEVRKKIVTENGKTVKEEILEETVVKEPEDEIILTGTRDIGGADGASSGTDEGVSRDESATYSRLRMPVDDVYVSSGFGTRWGRLHRGVDLALAQGSPVYAADSGTVYFSGDGGGYGNLIKVDHGNGMQTYYAHCSSLLVSSGQKVSRGEKIALTGSTGNSTGPHLHFEVIINGRCIDPAGMLGL